MSKSAWTASSSEAIAASLKTQITGVYLSLDQTIPETVSNGRPTFSEGVMFGTSPTVGAFAEGKAYYDSTKKTLSVEVGAAQTMNLGIQEFAFVNNPSGASIPKGSLVYPTGGVGDTPTVALAQADAEPTSLVLGITYEEIAAGDNGLVLVRGTINGLDTHLFVIGDTLYLSSTVAGGWTKTPPTTSEFLVRVGVVQLVHASTGSVYIRPVLKNRLADQADVTIVTPATDQVLRFNGVEWVNSAGVAASASKGVSFYYDGTEIIAVGIDNDNHVETLAKVPWSGAESVEDTTVVSTTSPVLSDIYLYDAAVGRTTLEAGAWIFSCYCAVNLAAGVSQILHNMMRVRPGAGTVTMTNGADATHRVVTASTGTPFAAAMVDVGGTRDSDSYLRSPLGVYRITTRTDDTHVIILVPSTYSNESAVAFSVHKRLFQVTTGEINNTATAPLYAGIQLYTINSVQPSYTILATDKLAVYRFAATTSAVAKHLYFAYGGTTRYSRVDTPLATVHGDLAVLQGGAGAVPNEEYYHLTAAEHLIAVTIATDSLPGYLSAADHTTFAAKESALTFSSGLTRAANTITNDLITGLAGGQSIYGGTLTTQGLSIYANKADLTGVVDFPGTTASTLPSNGAVTFAAGVGIVGQVTAAILGSSFDSLAAGGFSSHGLMLENKTVPYKCLCAGYDGGRDRAYIQAIHFYTGYKDVEMCPNGGVFRLPFNIASTDYETGTAVIGGGLGVAGAQYNASTIDALGNIVTHGLLQSRRSTGDSEISLVSIAGYRRGFGFYSGGDAAPSVRWYLAADNAAESGSDVGSNFNITAYTDAAGLIDVVLGITRAAGGAIAIGRPIESIDTVKATGYLVGTDQVVGAQVATIGFDAKTDTAKITDLIALLRSHGLAGPDA
jgi:hypothetical protein